MSSTQDRDFGQVLKEVFDGTSSSLRVLDSSNLIPNEYDTIQLSYSGGNLTEVVYKLNGLTVATLDLTYSGSNLIEVVRS